MIRAQWAAPVVLGVLGAAPPLKAEPVGASPVAGATLGYEAPEGCPDAGGFAEQVEGRLIGGSVAEITALKVRVEREAQRYRGTLLLQASAGGTRSREVIGDSCDEVVDALAVVAAIALREDGQASDDGAGPAAPASAEAAPNSVSPSGDVKQEEESAKEKAAANQESETTGEPDVSDERPPPAPSRFVGASVTGHQARHRKIQVSAGTVHLDMTNRLTLNTGMSFGLVRGAVVPRYELVANGALFLTTPDGRQEMLGLMPQLRISAHGPGRHRESGVETDVYGVIFDMGICYSPHYDSGAWVILGCIEYGGGIFDLQPVGSSESESVGVGRVSVDLEAAYNFHDLFHLSLRGGAESWIVGNGSALRRSVLGESEHLGAFGTIGIGLHF